ncbi:MAG: mechanosensitive ion channel protein MscS [Desulfuromonas sp.]|nr:MAG: mechanosensitive ion channel protein MscS [Desulfuromonas sp.]
MWLSLLWLVAAIVAGLLLNAVLFKVVLDRFKSLDESRRLKIRARFYPLLQLLIPILILLLFLPSLELGSVAMTILSRLTSLFFIGLVAWGLIQLVFTGREVLLARYDIDVKDNLKARAVHTQVNVLVKIGVIVIGVVAVASAMMIFENVRQLGTSILASAGVLGIIVGFAAQRSIATLLAGLQLAITQPIRIDDVVIVEGEWGQIEEITLTYVVVRIWDLRRLVLPTSYFLEKPFQNWTRTSADLLATVTVNVDYRMPVERVREYLQDILKANGLWDGKVWRLQVTGAGEQTIELRALMSAANASDAWDLRCQVREQLIDFLQSNHTEFLPRLRAEVSNPDS